MKIYATNDYQEMSRKAANILSAQVILKPDCVLGLATGSTPIGTYDQLVDWYKKGDVDFSEVKTVNLDEYRGLTRDNDQSYYYFMHEHLFDRVNIKEENTHVPDGTEPDAQKECDRYEALIESMGGVDIQLLGLGHNGHIGFNEPDSVFPQRTHCVNLTESTIEANKSIHHGYRNDYEGKEDSPDCKWRGQSRYCGKSIFRPCDSGSSGVYSAAAQRCDYRCGQSRSL